jgi:hypothetical protein
MSRVIVGGCALLAVVTAAIPATAQVEQLPAQSRSEAHVNSLNNSMARDQQLRGVVQQNQFETNQFRQQTTTQPIIVTPPIVLPPSVAR